MISLSKSTCTFTIWAASSEFVSSSILSWQILAAHAQPFRGARDLAFCLKVPFDSILVWASSGGSGETARMRRLAWTFAARICDKYQIRLTRPILSQWNYHHVFTDIKLRLAGWKRRTMKSAAVSRGISLRRTIPHWSNAIWHWVLLNSWTGRSRDEQRQQFFKESGLWWVLGYVLRYIWVTSWENLSVKVCDLVRFKPAKLASV